MNLASLYRLPRPLLATLLIAVGIVFMILNDPPHTFCDSQLEQFKKLQKGILYPDPTDYHKEKSILKRTKTQCESEGAPGACYEYFSYIKRVLRDFRVLSPDCKAQIYAKSEVKKSLSSALSLITALAFREEVLTGQVSKFHWLTRADLTLFCEIKNKYIMEYGRGSYQALEAEILNLLPVKQKVPLPSLKKGTILSESCLAYK